MMKFKKVLSFVLTIIMIISLSVDVFAEADSKDLKAKSEIAAGADAPKLVFLYIGYCGWYNPPYTDINGVYTPYTKEQIDKLSNADGFVLCHLYGVTFDNYNTTYIPYVIDTLKTVLSSKPDAKFWLATPATIFYHSELGYLVQDIPSQEEYSKYLKDLKAAIINDTDLGSKVWKNNISGMYYFDEEGYVVASNDPKEQTFLFNGENGVPRYYTGCWQEYKSPLGFVKEMGKTTNEFELKFLWSPYFYVTTGGKLVQQIFDADIFDYIIIQSSYYFWWNDITVLQTMHGYIANQSIDNITSNKTQLGVQMEVDENATIYSSSQTKYNATVDAFKDIVGKYVCSYYAGASPALDYDAVATSINNFYNKSADAASCLITTPTTN